jgi:hypothetical protein
MRGFVRLSVCYLSVCLSVCLSVGLSVHLFVCLSMCLINFLQVFFITLRLNTADSKFCQWTQANSVHCTLPTPTVFVKLNANLCLCQSTEAIKASRRHEGRPFQGWEVFRDIPELAKNNYNTVRSLIKLNATVTSWLPAGTAII